LRELDWSTKSSNVSNSFTIKLALEGNSLSSLNNFRPELAHFITSSDMSMDKPLQTVLVNRRSNSTWHARILSISSEASRTGDNVSMVERNDWHILSIQVNMSSFGILSPEVALPFNCKILYKINI
jgi:hypothetical protein